MTDLASSEPDPEEFVARLRRLRRRARLWLILGLVLFGLLLVSLAPLAIRFPGASGPAILSAAFGYHRTRRRAVRGATPLSGETLMQLQGQTVLWGIIGGGVGYAALATFGIGVPAPEAALGWRVFGGAVFGAAAGAVAGSFIPILSLVVMLRGRRLNSSGDR